MFNRDYLEKLKQYVGKDIQLVESDNEVHIYLDSEIQYFLRKKEQKYILYVSERGKETEEKIKKQSALKDQAFAEAAKRLLDIDSEREQAVREVKNDALARNIARSSIASEGVRETEERAAALRRDAQAERDGTAEAIDREIEALKKQASDSLSQTEKNFLSRLEAETEKLREKALEEKTEAEKAVY